MAKTIVVTGACGFLGRYVARRFSKSGWTVFGIGHSRANFSPSSIGLSHWVESDLNLSSMSALISKIPKVDVIFHGAGSGSVGASWEAPFADLERTAITTAAVIESIRRFSPGSLLIYPSSAAVYGDSPDEVLTEESALRPMSPYGVHKLVSEELCFGAHRIFGVRVAVIRFFSVYGPELRKQLLWDIAKRLSTGVRTLALDGTGEEQRDFLYVEDAARLVEWVASQCKENKYLVFNGATGVPTTVASIARLLVELLGRTDSVSVEFSGRCRPGDPARLVGDIQKLTQAGFASRMGIRDGIVQFANSLYQ